MQAQEVTQETAAEDQAWLAATNYLTALEMKQKADEMLATQKARFIAAAKRAGLSEVETDSGTVYWYPAAKRKVRNTLARDILTGTQLDAITVPTVVLGRLDAAVELGIITKAEVAEFVTKTPYEAVKVK